MEIATRETGDVMVVEVQGRLVRGAGDELLQSTLDTLLAEGRKKILVNLSGVPFIDSCGVGELVAGKRIAEHFGARIKLVELAERVENTLKLGLLLPLFEAYESETEALEAFAGEQAS